MTNEGQDTERPGALIAEEPNGQVRPGGDVKPPPYPLDKWWFLHVDGSSYGPYTGHQLKEFVGEGRVTPESVVAREGAQDWVKASEDQTLAPLFRKAPLEAQLSAGNGATVVQVNQSFGGATISPTRPDRRTPGSRCCCRCCSAASARCTTVRSPRAS